MSSIYLIIFFNPCNYLIFKAKLGLFVLGVGVKVRGKSP